MKHKIIRALGLTLVGEIKYQGENWTIFNEDTQGEIAIPTKSILKIEEFKEVITSEPKYLIFHPDDELIQSYNVRSNAEHYVRTRELTTPILKITMRSDGTYEVEQINVDA